MGYSKQDLLHEKRKEVQLWANSEGTTERAKHTSPEETASRR